MYVVSEPQYFSIYQWVTCGNNTTVYIKLYHTLLHTLPPQQGKDRKTMNNTTNTVPKPQAAFSIVEEIGVLSETGTVKFALRRIEWKNQRAKLDLRKWGIVDGTETPYKGVVMTDEEAAALYGLLKARYEGGGTA